MATILGMECKLYQADAVLADDNTPADASWTEVESVKDVRLGLTKKETDMTTRENDGWEVMRGTLKTATLTLSLLYDSDVDIFDALLDSYLNNTEIALAVMDGDIDVSGNQGFCANFEVMEFPIDQVLAEGVTVNATVKPRSQAQWYEVGS